jgi:hypothetical protein
MIPEQELIQKLSAWLKENRVTTLADKLGYRSTATINTWIRKRRIPPYMQSRVYSIINKERSA